MMAHNISKRSNGSSKFSGSSATSVLSFGFLAIGFSGSGSLTCTYEIENGNAAAETSPILKSDISEQF
jgi:hypothetical protein